jgi:hypothetical protein
MWVYGYGRIFNDRTDDSYFNYLFLFFYKQYYLHSLEENVLSFP